MPFKTSSWRLLLTSMCVGTGLFADLQFEMKERGDE